MTTPTRMLLAGFASAGLMLAKQSIDASAQVPLAALAGPDCPMPVHVLDPTAPAKMPTFEMPPAADFRMPIVKPRCVNPLGPKDADGSGASGLDDDFRALPQHPIGGERGRDALPFYRPLPRGGVAARGGESYGGFPRVGRLPPNDPLRSWVDLWRARRFAAPDTTGS